MWKREKKVEEKTVRKETSLLKELCGDDTELYDVLRSLLYANPVAAVSKEKLEVLIKAAEKSSRDESYEKAKWKYRQALDKAIFEASQHPNEKSRYIGIIQDITAKAGSYALLNKRAEDVIRIASTYYGERLEELGASERREMRRQVRDDAEREEKRTEYKEEESREARRQERKGMGRRERKEAEQEDEKKAKKARDERAKRRQDRARAEREEKRTEDKEEESREARRRKLVKTR